MHALNSTPCEHRWNIRDTGAIADGETLNTEAIQSTIEACADAGGGEVYVPPGIFLTGSLRLRSHVTLHVEAGATLLFSRNLDHYPTVRTRWEGFEVHAYAPCLFIENAEHVTVRGRGTLDGQGDFWWSQLWALQEGVRKPTPREREFGRLNSGVKGTWNNWDHQFLRPVLVQFKDCRNVLLADLTLQNSPFWNTHVLYSENVTVHNVTFKNPEDAPNGDGLDIDSCKGVRVSDCHFDVGDDCVCLKSGYDEDGRRVGRPCEDVVVSNCIMERGHGGVVMGSEIAGGISNVTINNCVFRGTDRGIRIKANRGRGGYVKNVVVGNIIMDRVMCPFVINAYYKCGANPDDAFLFSRDPQPITETTPVFENIRIHHVVARNATAAAGYFIGLPEMPITNVTLDNVFVEMSRDPKEKGGVPAMIPYVQPMTGEGFHCIQARHIAFRNVRIETGHGPALRLEQVEDVHIEALDMQATHAGTPVLLLNNVKRALVSKCLPASGHADAFLEIKGPDTADIFLAGNAFRQIDQSVRQTDLVPPEAVIYS